MSETLQWEDCDPVAGRWWMSRARDSSSGIARDFFIAQDDMTDTVIALVRYPPQARYTVVAAVFLDKYESRAAAADALKDDVAATMADGVCAGEIRRGLRSWRLVRTATIARKNLPFVLLGLGAGALLGLSVALFAMWTELVGWPIVAAGIALGAAAGVLLKVAVDAYRAPAITGPWGRLALITLGAIVGAGATATGILVLFWH